LKQVLVTFGKIKEPFIRDGINEYLHRIQRYDDVELLSLKEEKITPHHPESWLKDREGKRLLRQVPQDGLWVALERTGKKMDSRQFFAFIQDRRERGVKKIYYLIGGPLGLSPEVLEQADFLLSLSALTYPHELSTLILLEQIYRFFTFISGERYHK
jgi:23S rRNA (pseudouridine1915-N3)-methyltransferase